MTSMSPLQFHKQVRLQAARIADVGFAVAAP
jgi:hypothetical protein